MLDSSQRTRKEMLMKGLVPIVMANVNGIYGLVLAIILAQRVPPHGTGQYSVNAGFAHFAAGIACGLCTLGSSYAIGYAGNNN
jgi:V-type H+-transporting ATPase proteolipid subunit